MAMTVCDRLSYCTQAAEEKKGKTKKAKKKAAKAAKGIYWSDTFCASLVPHATLGEQHKLLKMKETA